MSGNEYSFTHEDRKSGIYKTVAVLIIIVAILLGLFINRVLQPRILSPKEMVNSGAVMFQLPREISDFELIDKKGGGFNKDYLKGHWTFVFFGFTYCPDICPTTLALFNKLHGKLLETRFAEDTKFLLVSVDPARDTPEKIEQYVDYFNPEFQAITGDFVAIKQLANQLNVAFRKVVTNVETGDYTIDHGGNVALIDPNGHYHGFYKPPLDAERMFLTYRSLRMANE